MLLLGEGRSLDGPGADSSPSAQPPLPPSLLLTPGDLSSATQPAVVLTYGNGEVEKLPFFIVPDQAPTRFVPAAGLLAQGALS